MGNNEHSTCYSAKRLKLRIKDKMALKCHLDNYIYYKKERIIFKLSLLSKKVLLILVFLSTS